MDLSILILILSCAAAGSEALVIVQGSNPGKCNETNHGKQVLVKSRENNELVIFCTKNDGVYKWTTFGGSNPIGENFSPGYDCSDILNNIPEAKDGLYWVDLGSNAARKVYCDMVTDGGGYMLIGRTNTSVTWNVPSDDSPVEPYGDPHWASYLGDAPILDFRIQMAIDEDLTKTIAHWSLRLQAERLLKNLMIIDRGCAQATPGIGNIAYVKDLQTENIVTTNFRCSVFGGYYDPATGFGWNMMNSCLEKPCRRGFAFYDHDIIKFQVDHSGSFSYSASGSISGIYHNSTAFVGCDKKKCCGCFSPVGGKDDYCGTDCTKGNGGTVIKNVYTWFWVRTSLPKKVWNKCMDYKVETENGDVVWYKLLNGNPTPEKGLCGRREALMNDGIVVVPDAETANKVPAIPGLLEYRKDIKKLYVRSNETWSVVPQEKTVIKTLNNDIAQLKFEYKSEIAQHKTALKSDIVQFKKELKSEMVQLQTELKGNIAQLKKGLTSEIAQLRSELISGIVGINQVIKNMNGTFNNLFTVIKVLDPSVFGSVILSGELYYPQLLKSWIGRSFTANLCWRATRDGWAASTFHSNCDNKVPTVTIVKVGIYIFGGYATASWSAGGNKRAPGSFMFSFRNKENLPPFKAPLKDQNTPYAIYGSPGSGPRFGSGHDLFISDNAASNTGSYTRFNYKYQPPSGVSNTNTILAGTYEFTPTEVEVFYLV